MIRNELPYAVVLDIRFAGYGIIRSLHDCHIPVIGLKQNKFIPEAGTRLCEKILTFQNHSNLLEILKDFAAKQSSKPILYLVADEYVNFVAEHYTLLSGLYRIHFPETSIVELLMDKLNFSEFAGKNNILIPQTFYLRNYSDPHSLKEQLIFPVILKPWLRTEAWKKNVKTKAFLIHSFDEFISVYERVIIHERNLLLQQYIPGGDENVYYCLTYFDDQSNCLAAFTGQKIRQWPVQTGSTATTAPIENEFVKNETLRIFRLLNYKGFGSVEYKKHDIDGKFYVMEPTVGRLNQQEFVATLNGTNIPLIAYNSLAGTNIQPLSGIKKTVVYIDEVNELRSVIKLMLKGKLTLRKWLKSIKGHRAYRYSSINDPGVAISLLLWPFIAVIKRIGK